MKKADAKIERDVIDEERKEEKRKEKVESILGK